MAKKKQDSHIYITSDTNRNKINWYPGHMNKAIKQIVENIKKVDIILEIRDARSPLVTGNDALNSKIGGKAKLIVINKMNLADPQTVKQWKTWFTNKGDAFLFINCLDKNSLKQVVELAKSELIKKRGPEAGEKKKIKMMIVGLPNTGKSTIINRFANKNATKAAAKPGQTQNQKWVRIGDDLDLLDTPGVMPPNIQNQEQGLWLSAIHAIPDRVVGAELPACYIVEHLLKKKSEIFKKKYSLEHLDGDLISTLDMIAKNRGCILPKNEYDYERVYTIVLNDFRKGDLGLVSFGLPPQG